MADTPIPEDLLAAQRRVDDAHRALVAAAPDIPEEERAGLRAAEREAVLALQAARAGTPWATVKGQWELQKAAREA